MRVRGKHGAERSGALSLVREPPPIDVAAGAAQQKRDRDDYHCESRHEERDLDLKLSEQLKVPVKLSIPRKYLGGNKSEERLHAVSKEMAQHLYLETKGHLAC